jgi:hypothetical protein
MKTTKSMILVIYWTFRRLDITRITAIAVICFGCMLIIAGCKPDNPIRYGMIFTGVAAIWAGSRMSN